MQDKELRLHIQSQAKILSQLGKERKKDDREVKEYLYGPKEGTVSKTFRWIWSHRVARMGQDWIFLALLGMLMAVISYVVDKGILMCMNTRVWLYKDLDFENPVARYLAWVSLPVCLVLFSAGFVSQLAPTSISSGIPEMKTILRGVQLKQLKKFLTFKTLVAKVIGLTATLGSGMPLGKEGPFVHIASILAQILSKLSIFRGIFENETRNIDMLAAACAVGVGACFASPVGGVLFSIEVTTTYFAVRNYWRGFFGAVCGALFFRLIAVWFHNVDTLKAIFSTSFTIEFPYGPQELLAFAMLGLICGILGALWVWVHRQYVYFTRRNKFVDKIIKKNCFLYAGILALMVSTITYPNGLGIFMAGELSTHQQVSYMFTNFTWSQDELSAQEMTISNYWTNPITGEVFSVLFGYAVFTFFFSIITSTMPVPNGIFIPVLKIGAALGRMVGEAMHLWFPTGVFYGNHLNLIIPGTYAVVGASAFAGAATHTVSVGVILFEMTGQITHLLPVMIATLISCAVAAILQPSIFDSIIVLKKLPYLPDLLPSGSGVYNCKVGDFMVSDVVYIWKSITFRQLEDILRKNKELYSIPLVDNEDTMVLLGTVSRHSLIRMIYKHIERAKRMDIESKRREDEEKLRKFMEQPRRSSKFEVINEPDVDRLRQIANNEMLTPRAKQNVLLMEQKPLKSILKKSDSFTMKGFNPLSPHSPTNSTDLKLRSAFDVVYQKSVTLPDAIIDPELGSPTATSDSASPTKKVKLPLERFIDRPMEEQRQWRAKELSKPINLDEGKVTIEPVSFHLMESTPLMKVHSLFAMTGINQAYVTRVGRLVGVVALEELRKVIEDINNGNLVIKSAPIVPELIIPETPDSPDTPETPLSPQTPEPTLIEEIFQKGFDFDTKIVKNY
ncbi:unnamed protein product [Chironomus riparius]|uniref:Chloride channel protein n=1 Tax=Chironomus riparius TaxID=315576 RepID=A0A9N9S6Y2_9DIPT|nr:unnamed protein product [Chironomus riparius]